MSLKIAENISYKYLNAVLLFCWTDSCLYSLSWPGLLFTETILSRRRAGKVWKDGNKVFLMNGGGEKHLCGDSVEEVREVGRDIY